MSGRCECGCGQAVNPGRRYVHGHTFKGKRRTAGAYYLVNENGCWIWQLRKTSNGYGLVDVNRRVVLAHRHFYEQARGAIPAGLDLDHLCRTRACVNPEHLEPVTRTENARRGAKTVLTVEQVREIRASTDSWSTLALRYGISKSGIANVKHRRTWKDVA
jgi:hypothetical protein